jgi:SAM-dependent methyltransferase
MDYTRAMEHPPPGWRHFQLEDFARLPAAIREHEMKAVPETERILLAQGDEAARERFAQAFFWTFVYHLEPERWDALAQVEPIHPEIVAQLPVNARIGLDIGAGSGRLTQHLVSRCRHVVAVEPAGVLRTRLRQRLPQADAIAGWAEAIPLMDRCSDLTAACGALGPEPDVLGELERVTVIGGLIALISPECPDWFEAHGWKRFTATALAPAEHPPWMDRFFGPPDPPRELFTKRVTA